VLRLSQAGDEKVMSYKGARRPIPPGDALSNLRGEWERIHIPYFVPSLFRASQTTHQSD